MLKSRAIAGGDATAVRRAIANDVGAGTRPARIRTSEGRGHVMDGAIPATGQDQTILP